MDPFKIPDRINGLPTGSEFIAQLESSGVGYSNARDGMIADQILKGNMPNFMRNYKKIPIDTNAWIWVLPDVLCVGTDEDYCRVPLNPVTYQRICTKFGASPITRKVAAAVWKAAEIKLTPEAMTPERGFPYDDSMMTTSRFTIHNNWIEKSLKAASAKLGQLISGHKKDVVLCIETQAPQTKNVAICGWYQPNGIPIQGLNYYSHELTYRDYSHGMRIMSVVMELGDKELFVPEVLKDANLCRILSDERDLNTGRYIPFNNPFYVDHY